MQTLRKILYVDNDLRRQSALVAEITHQSIQELLDIRTTMIEGGEFIDVNKYSAIFIHINNPEYDFFIPNLRTPCRWSSFPAVIPDRNRLKEMNVFAALPMCSKIFLG